MQQRVKSNLVKLQSTTRNVKALSNYEIKGNKVASCVRVWMMEVTRFRQVMIAFRIAS